MSRKYFLNLRRGRADETTSSPLVPAMNLPFHLLRLQSAPTERDSGLIRIVPRSDVQWGGPIFRAPALPTTLQINSELPFFVNFTSKPKVFR